MDSYYKQFDNCRQKEEADCVNACPFHLDVPDFQEKMQRHKYDRAYKVYRNAVLFPQITAELCPQYCSEVCPRNEFDGAVRLRLLEKTCVAKAERKKINKYNLPLKKEKIGIIGAGISGLACAVKLLEKKYSVILFEKEAHIGGQLKSLLPEAVYMTDIMFQLEQESYELKTGYQIDSFSAVKEFGLNAIYVATGKNGADFNTLSKASCCYIDDGRVVLGGGALRGKEVVASIADGIDAAKAIELFFQTGKLKYNAKRKATKVVPDVSRFEWKEPVTPTEHGIFTKEEVELEAGRCIRCQCNACQTHCDLARFYQKWPLAIREEIATTVMPAESMIHKAPAIRLVNTCTQCGTFEDVCPEHIELGGMILKARNLLYKQNKMPPAYHGFWLDDMNHANHSKAKICRNAPGTNSSEYAFFPGCNLGAADPRYVEKTYQWLRNHYRSVGLLLRCCGIHALWSGRDDFQREQLAELKQDVESLGNPKLIMACPSCIQYIQRYMPEIEVISLYELMENGKTWPKYDLNEEFEKAQFAIFDSCSAKDNSDLKNAVRAAAKQAGIEVEELAANNQYGCCGFGGDIEVANPEFKKYLVAERCKLSEKPYITYCVNCRDVFAEEKKPVIHILDLLFDINKMQLEVPNYTQRRKNRLILKKKLTEEVWKEKVNERKSGNSFVLIIDEQISHKMQLLKLTEDDLTEVIETSNKINRRVYDQARGEYICYAKLNYITCWIRYREESNLIYVKNLYTHRMEIQLEAVWNGKKINIDV